MCLSIGGLQLLEGGVRVDLCCGEAAVPEEGLDGVDICAVVEHLSGEGMS